MKTLVLAARLIFGAWMVFSGLNHFVLHVVPLPPGSEPLAVQLMAAFVHSGLIDVAMGMQLACGALILAGVFLPAALCVLMPVSVCAAFWTVILERDPMWGALALAAVAFNALLMWAHLDYYKGMLRGGALAVGES
jgi:hypothetical protein